MWGEGHNKRERQLLQEDEFFDAQSLLSSMQSLAMSSASLPDGGGEELSDATLSKMHDLAASVRQVCLSSRSGLFKYNRNKNNMYGLPTLPAG